MAFSLWHINSSCCCSISAALSLFRADPLYLAKITALLLPCFIEAPWGSMTFLQLRRKLMAKQRVNVFQEAGVLSAASETLWVKALLKTSQHWGLKEGWQFLPQHHQSAQHCTHEARSCDFCPTSSEPYLPLAKISVLILKSRQPLHKQEDETVREELFDSRFDPSSHRYKKKLLHHSFLKESNDGSGY